jgi:hypothetical protein
MGFSRAGPVPSKHLTNMAALLMPRGLRRLPGAERA